MNDINADKINTDKIHAQVNHIRNIRLAPKKTMVVGWDEGMVPPTAANALEKAGLAVISVNRQTGLRTVTAL